MAIKNKAEKMRFGIVGIINTSIDFGVLFILTIFGLPAIVANIISTSAAFSFSFVANKKVTFQTKDTNVKREFILFILVTLFGLWVLQSIFIIGTQYVLSGSGLSENIILLIGKIVGSCVTLIWNYLMYSRVVFKPSEKNV